MLGIAEHHDDGRNVVDAFVLLAPSSSRLFEEGLACSRGVSRGYEGPHDVHCFLVANEFPDAVAGEQQKAVFGKQLYGSDVGLGRDAHGGCEGVSQRTRHRQAGKVVFGQPDSAPQQRQLQFASFRRRKSAKGSRAVWRFSPLGSVELAVLPDERTDSAAGLFDARPLFFEVGFVVGGERLCAPPAARVLAAENGAAVSDVGHVQRGAAQDAGDASSAAAGDVDARVRSQVLVGSAEAPAQRFRKVAVLIERLGNELRQLGLHPRRHGVAAGTVAIHHAEPVPPIAEALECTDRVLVGLGNAWGREAWRGGAVVVAHG